MWPIMVDSRHVIFSEESSSHSHYLTRIEDLLSTLASSSSSSYIFSTLETGHFLAPITTPNRVATISGHPPRRAHQNLVKFRPPKQLKLESEVNFKLPFIYDFLSFLILKFENVRRAPLLSIFLIYNF
jgi:hypothetical protein